MPKPVIVLAFANEPPGSDGYLRNLDRELTALKQLLRRAEDAGLCELEILSRATLDDIFDVFQRPKFRNRIAVFHFSGHAGSQEIFVTNPEGGKTSEVHSAGLVPFLGSEHSLHLVFINGCLSIQQAKELSRCGVPAVIGTLQAVDDQVATDLSLLFYESLADGLPLEEAWREATLQMIAGKGSHKVERYYRGLDLTTEETLPFPWELLYREGSESVKEWSLPAAADNLLFGLPPVPSHYALPEAPYRFLSRYEKDDAQVFFGRSRYIRELYQRIISRQSAPLLLLFGQSGVGKSSLLSAGVFPRLESHYDLIYLRRSPESGLDGALLKALELETMPTDARSLLVRWLELEAATDKKGRIIIIDQAEEAFTRPSKNKPDEWTNFWVQVKNIFDQPNQRPKGKLILSYRKEYDSEIDKMAADFRIEREKIFLEKLNEKDIIEVVSGLTSNENLRRRYRLQIEKGLPQEIAGNLIMDKDSAIAPVLQIILTKLWERQVPEYERWFKKEDYGRLREEGILLHDFFEQQMTKIKAWETEINKQVESSGLALDILNYHTTDYGTAESRNLNELRKLYQHQDEVLDQLIKKFQELYLLSDADAHSTALAHDTLAPVIHKKMKDSDKPGQRAWRILQAKMADYAVNPQSTILEEDDLALVVHGASGMRMWVSKEKELIDRSKKRKEELEAARKRNRRFRRVAVVVIAILGVISSIFWQLSEREKRKVEANNKFNEGRIMLDRDPTAGLAMMVEGWHENSADSAKLTMIYETYARGIFYEIVATTDGAQLNAAAFSEDGRYAAIGTDHPDRAIRLYDLNSGKIIDTLSGPANPVSSVTFFKNHYIFAGSLDRQAYRWAPNGSEMLAFKKQEGQDSSFVKQVAVSADGGRIATVHTDLAVRLWDANSGAFTGEISLNDPVTAIAFSLTDQALWLAFEDGNIAAYNPKNQQTARYKMGQTAIRALAFSRQGNAAAGCANGQLLTWKTNNPAKVLHQTQAHQGAIGALAFSGDGNFVVTGSTDLTAKVWEVATGDLVNTLKGHTAAIHSAAFSADAGFLLTASEDRTVRRWSFAYPLPLQVAGEDLGYINDLDWLPDGHVVAVTRYDKQVSWGATRFQNPVVSDLEESPTTVIASPDGKKLAIGDENGGVKVWNLTPNGHQLYKVKQVHETPLSTLAFSASGSLLLACTEDGKACLWAIDSEEAPIDLVGHTGLIRAVAILPEDKLAATLGEDGTLRYWDLQTGNPGSIRSIPKDINDACFSNSGAAWALAVPGDSILWCTPETGCGFRSKGSLPVISPDGDYYAAVALSGKEVELRTKEGHLCKKFEIGEGLEPITCLAFDRSGRFLSAGTKDGKLLLWRNDRLKLE